MCEFNLLMYYFWLPSCPGNLRKIACLLPNLGIWVRIRVLEGPHPDLGLD